jgi:hypothetical protein
MRTTASQGKHYSAPLIFAANDDHLHCGQFFLGDRGQNAELVEVHDDDPILGELNDVSLSMGRGKGTGVRLDEKAEVGARGKGEGRKTSKTTCLYCKTNACMGKGKDGLWVG